MHILLLSLALLISETVLAEELVKVFSVKVRHTLTAEVFYRHFSPPFQE